MEPQAILALYDEHQRRAIEYPGMKKEVLPHVTRFLRPAPGMSFVLHSRLDESNADQVIQEQIHFFRQHKLPFQWQLYDHDRPADLRARLLAHGFEAEESDAIMVLELHAVPPPLLAPVQADVRPIRTLDELRDVMRVEEQVWGRSFDWMPDRHGKDLTIPGYLNMYVAYVAGDPACAAWLYFHPDSPFASLWGGSTVPHLRRRGLYTALLATRVQAAIARDYRFLTIDAGAMSAPIVARHGFQRLTNTHVLEWKGAQDE